MATPKFKQLHQLSPMDRFYGWDDRVFTVRSTVDVFPPDGYVPTGYLRIETEEGNVVTGPRFLLVRMEETK